MGRTNTRSSMAEAIDLQELGTTILTYGEFEDPAMRHINPSIAWSKDGKLKIAIRSCNFSVERHGKWYFRDGSAYSKTDVLFGDLDPDTLQVTNLEKLNLSSDSPTRTLVAGLEDVRLFSRNDGMHAIGFECDRLSRSLHNASASLTEYIIKGNTLQYIRTLEKPNHETVEKNWSPPDVETPYFEFTYSPTQVWQAGHILGEPYSGNVHGGTQLLEQKDGTFISLVHEKKLDTALRYLPRNNHIYDKYIYYTHLAIHGEDGIITKLSRPFRFGTLENIEFASGMIEHDGHLLITLGIRDCKYAIAKVSKNKLLELLNFTLAKI